MVKNWRFGTAWCLDTHALSDLLWLTSFWLWRYKPLPRWCCLHAKLHGVTSRKTWFFTKPTIKASVLFILVTKYFGSIYYARGRQVQYRRKLQFDNVKNTIGASFEDCLTLKIGRCLPSKRHYLPVYTVRYHRRPESPLRTRFELNYCMLNTTIP